MIRNRPRPEGWGRDEALLERGMAGEMAERSKALDWNSSYARKGIRGFESHSLRQLRQRGPLPPPSCPFYGGSHRFLRDDQPRIPPGPEGSNGSDDVGCRRRAGAGCLLLTGCARGSNGIAKRDPGGWRRGAPLKMGSVLALKKAWFSRPAMARSYARAGGPVKAGRVPRAACRVP
jgi:hypothetical protein